MTAYYNEFDPGAATTLEVLITERLIPPGVVDRRSIKDVRADDLRGFTQCHFFAGIGIWPAALRAAGWDDHRPVWTGSCPCQPFSQAGKGLGFDDPRHLWPDWFRLIAERRPHTIFGEQSAAAGLWVDLVRTDLEGLGAAFGCVDLPAAGFAQGAHIRQRFDWVADIHDAERWADVAGRHFGDWPQAGRIEGYGEPGTGGAPGGVAHADGRDPGAEGLQRSGQHGQQQEDNGAVPTGGLANISGGRWREERPVSGRLAIGNPPEGWGAGPGTGRSDCDWLYCLDGAWRPVESGTFPLAATHPGRMGALRGYGNALDFEQTVAFVSAYLDADVLS